MKKKNHFLHHTPVHDDVMGKKQWLEAVMLHRGLFSCCRPPPQPRDLSLFQVSGELSRDVFPMDTNYTKHEIRFFSPHHFLVTPGLCSSIATISVTINSLVITPNELHEAEAVGRQYLVKPIHAVFQGCICVDITLDCFSWQKNSVNLCRIRKSVCLFFAKSKHNLDYCGYINHFDSLAKRCPIWRQCIKRIFIDR